MTKTPHEWRSSPLGHGEWQCIHCLATTREIAVIGDPNHCPDAHRSKFPATAKMEEHPDDTWHERRTMLPDGDARAVKARRE